jgi:hypothetical protein
MFVS